jgi:NhaP-type Na+/H+ or K+/H+ antiporter
MNNNTLMTLRVQLPVNNCIISFVGAVVTVVALISVSTDVTVDAYSPIVPTSWNYRAAHVMTSAATRKLAATAAASAASASVGLTDDIPVAAHPVTTTTSCAYQQQRSIPLQTHVTSAKELDYILNTNYDDERLIIVKYYASW